MKRDARGHFSLTSPCSGRALLATAVVSAVAIHPIAFFLRPANTFPALHVHEVCSGLVKALALCLDLVVGMPRCECLPMHLPSIVTSTRNAPSSADYALRCCEIQLAKGKRVNSSRYSKRILNGSLPTPLYSGGGVAPSASPGLFFCVKAPGCDLARCGSNAY